MKIKIRGLVFVGFAAAVFAQSAMAVVPLSIAYPTESQADLTAKDNLKKTVTSQLYTDETFQERILTPLNETGGNIESAVYVPWSYGQGNEPKENVKLESKNQLDSVATGNTNPTYNTPYVEIQHDKNNHHYIGIKDNTIAGSAARIDDAGAANATHLTKNSLTTAKAVYDFVTDELDEMGANIQGNVTYHTEKVAVLDSTFGQSVGLTSPYHVTQAQLDQNTTWAEHIDHWELIVPDSVVAESGSDIWNNGAGPAQGDYNDLTTAKAVYDVLTGAVGDGYQRKITTGEATSLAGFNNNTDAGVGVMVGHRATTSGADSEWYTFGAKANGVDISNPSNNHLSYLYVDRDSENGGRDKFLISIKNGVLAETAAAIEAGGTAMGDNAYLSRDKLTTAKAVFDYVNQITGGQNLPVMDSLCEVAGVHCALVTVYDPQVGQEGDPDYEPAGVHLEWTVMAGNN